jgi:hypothetical protein
MNSEDGQRWMEWLHRDAASPVGATYSHKLTPGPPAFGFPSSPQEMLERVASAMSDAVLKLGPGESITVTRNADDDLAPITLKFSGPARYSEA